MAGTRYPAIVLAILAADAGASCHGPERYPTGSGSCRSLIDKLRPYTFWFVSFIPYCKRRKKTLALHQANTGAEIQKFGVCSAHDTESVTNQDGHLSCTVQSMFVPFASWYVTESGLVPQIIDLYCHQKNCSRVWKIPRTSDATVGSIASIQAKAQQAQREEREAILEVTRDFGAGVKLSV